MAPSEKITIPRKMTFDRTGKRTSVENMDVSVDAIAEAITKISKTVTVKL